jgi:hypothetical protein
LIELRTAKRTKLLMTLAWTAEAALLLLLIVTVWGMAHGVLDFLATTALGALLWNSGCRAIRRRIRQSVSVVATDCLLLANGERVAIELVTSLRSRLSVAPALRLLDGREVTLPEDDLQALGAALEFFEKRSLPFVAE